MKDWHLARSLYGHALQADPTLGPIWMQLGHAAKESGDFSAAENAYRKALALKPTDADAHLQFGHLMKITGRSWTALASYSHAMALEPGFVDARREIEGLWRRGDVPGRKQNCRVTEADFAGFQRQASPMSGPDFLGIGMAKAGTGWIFDQLKYHPDFWMPPVKEFAYLKRGVHTLRQHAEKRLQQLKAGENKKLRSWSNRPTGDKRDIQFLAEAAASIGDPDDLASYGSLFRYKENSITGDITPGYGMLEPEIIAKVAKAFPNIKLLLLVRDPIERVLSHLSMQARVGKFDRVLMEDATSFRHFLDSNKGIAQSSFPSKIVSRWRTHAPDVELRWFFFSDLVKNPYQLLCDILKFLGAQTPEALTMAERNRKGDKEKLVWTTAAREIAVDRFRDELVACIPLFGEEAQAWAARYGVA